MNLNLPPVVIVSIFGRGYCLAESLKNEGIPVRLLDLSHLMGRLEVEEIEGPLALVDSPYLNLFQKQAWGVQETPTPTPTPQKNQFVVLTARGPLDFASDFFGQRLTALGGDSKLVEKYYQEQSSTYPPVSLDKVWPLALNHKLFALANMAPAEANRLPPGVRLTGTLWTRNAGAFKVQLENLKKQQSDNFQVLSGVAIEDISFKDRKRIDGLLLKKERSEVLTLSQLVWTLSASETKFISSRLFERLFAKKEVAPELVWLKWSFKIDIPELPAYFIILEDPCLPWMHQNFLILKQIRPKEQAYAVWSLLPADQRFNKNYLDNETRLLEQFFQGRFSFAKIELLDIPSEVQSTFVEKGPALHALYRPGFIEGRQAPVFEGFFASGLEARDQQGPNAEFSKESEIEMEVLKWWTKEQELAKKKEAKLSRKQENLS